MNDVMSSLAALGALPESSVPEFFNLGKESDESRLATLLNKGAVRHVSDDYEEQQRELYAIENPTLVYTPMFEELFRAHYASLQENAPIQAHGLWVYFPWRSLVAHVLPEESYRKVRTARNRNLITEEEQQKFYDTTIGIGGLSVGSSVALALALGGGAKHMKLADMDRLALSNTNRVLAGADRLGVLKVEMTARTIYEINPYANIELFSEGLHPENIEFFFEGLDIVVDELDNLAVKYLIREQAQKHGVPVLMAADNGDNAVVDVERYDLDPATPFFHGRMGDVSYEVLKNLDKFGIGKMITKHVGPENVTERMQQSLLEMGKTIVSWPQLGGAALLNGAAVAYCVRKICTGEALIDNRTLISLDERLDPQFQTPEAVAHRTQVSQAFAKSFGL